MSAHTATPYSKEVTQAGKDSAGGEVYIVDANGTRIFKGTGENYEGRTADFIISACNTHDELVDAVRELHALCLRLGIDQRRDINLAPITNAEIAFINATTPEYRAALAKASA